MGEVFFFLTAFYDFTHAWIHDQQHLKPRPGSDTDWDEAMYRLCIVDWMKALHRGMVVTP